MSVDACTRVYVLIPVGVLMALHCFCILGAYHGLSPTNQQSGCYGILHFTTDKSGKVTDITIWRAGFKEEREVLVSNRMVGLMLLPH